MDDATKERKEKKKKRERRQCYTLHDRVVIVPGYSTYHWNTVVQYYLFDLFIPRGRISLAFGVFTVHTRHGMGWLLYMALHLRFCLVYM